MGLESSIWAQQDSPNWGPPSNFKGRMLAASVNCLRFLTLGLDGPIRIFGLWVPHAIN